MNSTRSRSLYVMAVTGLIVLSLRPIEPAERFLDALVAPTRILAELGAPFVWLRASEVNAAEQRVLQQTWTEVQASRALLDVERRFARPGREELLEDCAALHAEVVARSVGNLDQIVIQLPERAQVQRGLPVVSGDIFVGRIARVDDPVPTQATVDLLTADDFFIGARLVPESPGSAEGGGFQPSEFVVGGLAPTWPGDQREISLAVHNPSNRDASRGMAVVDESVQGDGARLSSLANGFLLGRLEVLAVEPSKIMRLVPQLDYKEGLYQVLVLQPPELFDEPGSIPDAFDDGRWRAARIFLRGDTSFWRDSRKISLGRAAGVEAGAALAYGARFAGRVSHAGWLTSDVSLLGDPGLVVPALAELGGDLRPLPMGHLVSLGHDPDTGRVRLRWDAVVSVPSSVPGTSTVRARLYTGSGEEGVPRGLFIGETELPRGKGVFELQVEPEPALASLRRIKVRLRRAMEEPE